MSEKPLILICNDDGIHAPGIQYLAQCVQHMGDVFVVAPEHDQTSVGLSLTIRRPLKVKKIDAQSWSVDGTPADCIKLALTMFLPRQPDLILSGINRGSNAGKNVLYSGTIAAVTEGVLRHIPGIALSSSDNKNPNYEELQKYIPLLVDYVSCHPLPKGTFLNVNFPSSSLGDIKGLKWTEQGKRYLIEDPLERFHPYEGDPYYWLGAKWFSFDVENQDNDIAWLNQGYATVVPIQIADLTHYSHLDSERESFNQFLQSSRLVNVEK